MDTLIALFQDLGPLGIVGGVILILLGIGTVKAMSGKKGNNNGGNNGNGNMNRSNGNYNNNNRSNNNYPNNNNNNSTML